MKIQKHIFCYAALLAVVVVLSACGGGNNVGAPSAVSAASEDERYLPEATPESANVVVPEPAPEPANVDVPESAPEPANVGVPEPAGPEELALEQYRTIVGQADTYEYDSLAEPTCYRYALVRMQAGDAVPTLLLKQETTESLNHVRIFQYDPESGTVRGPSDILMEGAASVGGYRSGLAMQADGDGIWSVTMFSGTGDTSITRVTLEGDALHYDVQWEGRMDMMPDEPGAVGIAWYDVEDPSALDNWPETGDPTGPEAPAESTGDNGTSDGDAALPVDGDRIVFRGTIDTYTYDEVVKLQGEPDPNSEWADSSRTFRLIVLDTPQAMDLRSGDGMGSYESEVDLINVTYAEGLEQYDGQQLIFSIDPDATWWPSDTSLPLGRPSTSDVHVLP